MCYYLLFIEVQLCIFQESCQISLLFEITSVCLNNYLHNLLIRDRKRSRWPGDGGRELGITAKMYGVSFGVDGSDVELTVLIAQNNQHTKNHCIEHSNRELYVNYTSRNKKFSM